MYQLCQLYNDDCFNILPTIKDNSIDLILIDPPYQTTLCDWDKALPFDKMWEQIKRIRKDDTATIIFGAEPFSSYLRISNIKEFKYDIVWHKSKSGSAFTAKYRPVNKHEMISIFAKGKTIYNPQLTEGKPYHRNCKLESKTNNHKVGIRTVITNNTGFRYPTTVQYFQQKWRRQDQVHPTQKPVELLEWLIKTYSNENDTVLDFCMGSGTTGVACVKTNRRFIGIEIDETYFNIAKERIENCES